MINKEPKFIWIDDEYRTDSYVEFVSSFSSKNDNCFIDIAVDTDYELYINDEFINSNAYLSYPGKLHYDTLKLKVNKGLNKIRIIVYYNGADTFATYYKKDPVLYFKVYKGKNILAVSDSDVLSRYDSNYISFNEKRITYQLGYKVFYDFVGKENNFKNSVVTKSEVDITKRPNKKLELLDEIKGEVTKINNTSTIYDLKKELVGYLSIDINSKEEKDIVVSFGEHIKEGKILDKIDGRDFSFNIHLDKGDNKKVFYLRRIGCRYLSLDNCKDLVVNNIGLVPVQYPFKERKLKYFNNNDKELIDIAKHTIKCCYHEHFEDCPWREQAQYTFDMRCTLLGYHKVFKNKEAVRSALQLMIDDPRFDGDLDMTFPSKFYLVIPSFTLHFMTLIFEYYQETKDKVLVKQSLNKIENIISSYLNKFEDGLLKVKKDESHWIFYEWKSGFDGNGEIVPNKDFLLNVIFLYSLQLMDKMYQKLKVEFKFKDYIEPLKEKIIKEFYDEEKEIFVFAKENPITSELMLAYAILTNLVPEKNNVFAKQIVNKNVSESTNSFKSLVYEALLKVDKNYKEYILYEIREIYGKMIKDGATTFYETNLGYLDFNKAGSLCHGWNAFIIKYLVELGK